MFRNFFLKFTIFLIFALVLFSGFRLLSHPSVEYDEGAYLTTFMLVANGNNIYEKTFFSQLPGFFYSTYPGFLLFGQTLEAGRLTVFIWSLIALIAILWLSYEAGNILFGILAIAIIYNIPLFLNQSLTFHADSIPIAFSTLAIASILRFRKKHSFLWLLLSFVFFSLGVFVKLEISIIFSLIFIVLDSISKKIVTFKKSLFIFLSFLLLFIIIFYLSILPFGGFTPFYNSFLSIRGESFINQNFSGFKFFEYLFNLKPLFFIITASFVLSAIFIFKTKKKEENFFFFVFIIWSITVSFFLIIYRPLFLHHLVLLTVPFSLLFSYLIIFYANKLIPMKLLKIAVFLFTAYTMLNLINISNINSQKYKNDLQSKGIDIINKNTDPKDYVVSDDGFLNAFTKRLPPPWLTDISDVRVTSNALTKDVFEKNIKEYEPKLVMSWSGRIKKIKDFEKIMANNNYKVLEVVDAKHKAFILKTPH